MHFFNLTGLESVFNSVRLCLFIIQRLTYKEDLDLYNTYIGLPVATHRFNIVNCSVDVALQNCLLLFLDDGNWFNNHHDIYQFRIGLTSTLCS